MYLFSILRLNEVQHADCSPYHVFWPQKMYKRNTFKQYSTILMVSIYIYRIMCWFLFCIYVISITINPCYKTVDANNKPTIAFSHSAFFLTLVGLIAPYFAGWLPLNCKSLTFEAPLWMAESAKGQVEKAHLRLYVYNDGIPLPQGIGINHAITHSAQGNGHSDHYNFHTIHAWIVCTPLYYLRQCGFLCFAHED